MFSKSSPISHRSHGSPLAVPAAIGVAVLGMAALAMNAPVTKASFITWGTPTDVSADTDVSTTGSLVSAYTFGANPNRDATNTINGVPFAPVIVTYTLVNNQEVYPTSVAFGGDTVAAGSGGALNGYDGFSSGTGPTALSTAYQSLLTSAVYEGTNTTTLGLTLNGLTSGQTYQFETWVSDARSQYASSLTGLTETVGSAGDLATLAYYTGPLNAGQFVLGTFTADSTGSQTITYSGAPVSAGGSLMNAFQLREVSAIPEPATLGVMAVGSLGLLLLKRRKTA